jgi:hypothetical protein
VPAPGAGRERRREVPLAVALAVLVAAAALLRALAWWRTAVLFDDGPRFLAIAHAMADGWWDAALRDSFHPLYPALTALAHRLLGAGESAAAWETAGALVSVAGGAAAVGFLFLFLRDAFGPGPAWCGALLLAVHGRAIEYASDVQSDGLYLGLFAAGLWAGWRAWRGGSPALAAVAGAASGLAYLTRPEGLGLAVVLGGLGVASVACGRWRLRAGAAWIAALALATAVWVGPYVWALHRQTGEWTLTHKKPIAALVGAAAVATPGAPTPPPDAGAPAARGGAAPVPREVSPPPPWLDALGLAAPAPIAAEEMAPEYLAQDGLRVALAPSPGARAFEALRMLVRHGIGALRYGVLALAVVGLWACRGRPGPRGVYLLATIALYVAALFALTASSGYVSRRHALPPLLPLFGLAGVGALAVGARLATAVGQPRWSALAGGLVAIAFAAGELAGQVAPKRLDELAGRRAAEWLRDHAPARGRLAASRQRLGYYAEMPYVPLTGVADHALSRYLSRTGTRYVVVEEPGQLEALRRAEGDAVRVLHHVEVAGERAWVLERRPPAGAEGP